MRKHHDCSMAQQLTPGEGSTQGPSSVLLHPCGHETMRA